MEAKDSFIIYTAFYKPISLLSDKQLGRLFRAIFCYNLGEIVNVEEDIRMAFEFFKNQFEIDESKRQAKIRRDVENGRKGGNPNFKRGQSNPYYSKQKNEDKAEVEKITRHNPGLSDITQHKAINENDNVNDNDNKKINKKSESEFSELEKEFERFRAAYPGTKRGFKAEFENFKRKYPKEWQSIIPLLIPALERMQAWRKQAQAKGMFVPQYAHLTTWLNQARWTAEYASLEAPNPNNANNESYKDRFSERRGVESSATDYESFNGTF